MIEREDIMKKLVLAVVCALLYIPLAGAYVIDGNVSDWGIDLNDANNMGYLDTHLPSGGLDIDVATEDNTDASQGWKQVYPGWSYKNKFDAEAIYFDNDAHNAYIASSISNCSNSWFFTHLISNFAS